MKYLLMLVIGFNVSYLVFAAEKVKGKKVAAATELQQVVTPGATAAVVEEAVKVPKTTGLTGFFEFRPTYSTKSPSYSAENTAAIGYRFNPDLAIEWTQYFGHNLYNQSVKSFNFALDDSFFALQMKPLWSNDSGMNLTFEPRMYLPTKEEEAKNGMVTALRTYFTLCQKLSEVVTLSISEIPILYSYSKAGGTRDKKPSANPIVGNNVYLVGAFNLGKGFTFSVPLYLYMKYNRSFASDTETSNRWVYKLHFWPELSYSVSESVKAGVSYRTGWLTNDKLGDFNASKAFNSGDAQVFISATL